MALRDGEDLTEVDRPIDHLELEDGTFLVFDPVSTDAWIQCRSPIDLAGQN